VHPPLLEQTLEVAGTVHDSEDENFCRAELIENQVFGKSGDRDAPDVAEFGMWKPADCACPGPI
jgi:hypothetical protein